jgi:hypothetical protein
VVGGGWWVVQAFVEKADEWEEEGFKQGTIIHTNLPSRYPPPTPYPHRGKQHRRRLSS